MKQLTDYAQLFFHDVPMLDVRAPVEHLQGSFPGCENAPILNDDERQKVGTCYKQQGQQQAIELGHKLVSGEIKEQRLGAWQQFFHQHPQGVAFCFRGGMRSQLSQQWLADAGMDVPIVKGGYKAMRRFLLQVIEQAAAAPKFILGGMTGTGKTEVLKRLLGAVDLEALANHRGSSFGRQVEPQPTQINFENALAVDILKKQQVSTAPLCYEDEGRMIGSVHLPLDLHASFKQAPLVYLQVSMQQRVDLLLREYVQSMLIKFVADSEDAEQGFRRFEDYLQTALKAITKRLGHQRFAEINQLQLQALEQQRMHQDDSAHRLWLQALLEDYYDPMYRYQLTKKQDRIVFSGDQDEVTAWLSEQIRNSD